MLKLIVHLFVAGLLVRFGKGAGLQWYFIVPIVLVGRWGCISYGSEFSSIPFST